MNVLQALCVTRDKTADFDSFVKAVLVLYANLSHDSYTGQCVYFELTEDEKDYIYLEMLSVGKDPYEEGLMEY